MYSNNIVWLILKKALKYCFLENVTNYLVKLHN